MFLLAREAVVQKCSVKKVFLKILENSQENNCARVSFLIKLRAFKVRNKNTRTTSVTYSLEEPLITPVIVNAILY